ncbi:MAG: hypothetical protein EB010_13365 [Acidimicrobiia bacterium]|nr:hypothetical protein [Acidimicrobiia bacterium]
MQNRVVAGVDDGGHVRWVDGEHQALQESGGTNPTGEYGDHEFILVGSDSLDETRVEVGELPRGRRPIEAFALSRSGGDHLAPYVVVL